jgi:hypothetical protein
MVVSVRDSRESCFADILGHEKAGGAPEPAPKDEAICPLSRPGAASLVTPAPGGHFGSGHLGDEGLPTFDVFADREARKSVIPTPCTVH